MNDGQFRIFGNGQKITAGAAAELVRGCTFQKNENSRPVLNTLEAARAMVGLLNTAPHLLRLQGTEPRKGKWRYWTGTFWQVYNAATLESDIEWIFEGLVSAKAVKDMAELLAIKLQRPHTEWDTKPIVVFDNHVLEAKGSKVQEYQGGFLPEDYITVNVPLVLPDKGGEHPVWDHFLELSLPNREDRMALAEMFGCAFFAAFNPQVFFTLLGPKGSGKSTVGKILSAMLGKDRVNATATCRLGNTHEAFALQGKLVNIDSEASFMTSEGEQILKAITGDDTIQLHPKYRDTFPVRLPTKMILISNDLPPFSDKTDALWDRLVVIPFLHSVPPEQRITDVIEELRPEFGAIVWWAMRGLRRVLQKGTRKQAFTQSAAALAFATQHRKMSNPVLAFMDDHCVMDSAAMETKADVYEAVRDYCHKHGHTRPYNAANVGKILMNIDGIGETRLHNNTRYYTGFKMILPP